MSCPDCKDGFYYPLIGPREPCQTCSHKATVTIDAQAIEEADRNWFRAVEGLYRMAGLPVFNPCTQCQWPVQQGKECPKCAADGDMLGLLHLAGIKDFEITPDQVVLPMSLPGTYHELRTALSLLMNSNYADSRFTYCFIVILRRMMQLQRNWGASDLAADLKLSQAWVLRYLNSSSRCWPCGKCGQPKQANEYCTHCTKGRRE